MMGTLPPQHPSACTSIFSSGERMTVHELYPSAPSCATSWHSVPNTNGTRAALSGEAMEKEDSRSTENRGGGGKHTSSCTFKF